MAAEQDKDAEIVKIKADLSTKGKGKASKYMTHNGILYYVSDVHNDPVMRLYVPAQFRASLMVSYHDRNGHFGVDKCYHTLARSYFWPNMFHDLWEYVGKCTQCCQRNLRKVKPPLRETDIPPYAGAKFSLDLAGPFPVTLSGNKYVVSFVDWLSGWIEAFPVPDKTADSVVFLLQTEIIPRFSCPLVLVTDNGTENLNKAMRETLESLRIHHIKTSVYHPQSNAKVERSHRTMNDILSKLMTDDKKCKSWDLHLPQALGAMRFSYNESTGQSPFSLLYGRDAVLPIDNLLQPRRKYYGEESHQILLEAQHEAFVRAHRRLKKQKKRQNTLADKGAVEINFKVGDPVFLRNHAKTCKLSPSWEPYYRIIEKVSPLTYRLKNQLTGQVVKSHAEHLVLAKTEWEYKESKDTNQRTRFRRVVSESDEGSCNETSDDQQCLDPERGLATWMGNDTQVTPAGSDCESERLTKTPEDSDLDEPKEYLEEEPPEPGEIEPQEGPERVEKGLNEQMADSEHLSMADAERPLNSKDEDIAEDRREEDMDLIRPLKREREGSSSEEDIPLAELSKRMRMREDIQREIEEAWSSEDDVPLADLRRAERQRELDEIRTILKIIEG